MGLMLCTKKEAERPYYIEELGIHIYSAQELYYIIFEHPLLAMDDFLTESLLEFMRNELDMNPLVTQLLHMREEGTGDDDLLFIILEESDYYSVSDTAKYRNRIMSYRKLKPTEYMKKKADYMFGLKRYGRAIFWYEKIVKKPLDEPERILPDAFMGTVYNNLGSAYANLFLLDHAYKAYDKAYRFTRDMEILKRIYYLSLMEPVIELKERYQSMVQEQMKLDWNEEYEKACMEAKCSPMMHQIDEIFSKDVLKRTVLAKNLIGYWKQEYRNMI